MSSTKIALVTGASRGIGHAIAVSLGKEGITVIGTSTTVQGAQKLTDSLNAAGVKGKGVVLDVTDSEGLQNSLASIKEQFGPINILVNNAAITQDNLLLRMKEEEWGKVIETNLNSIFRISKACLRDMLKARWGRIINITSVVGVTGNAGQVNYSAAKAGMIGFTKSLAQEVGSREVTVNAVAPGFIDTDMTRELPEDQRNLLLSRIPMQRLGLPEDIADAVVFLASDKAAYVTGQTLHINGGMYMGS